MVNSQSLKSQKLTSSVNVSLRWQIALGVSGGVFSAPQVVQPLWAMTEQFIDPAHLFSRWLKSENYVNAMCRF